MVSGHGSPLPVPVLVHSSMAEDISGIFQRFPCEKIKERAPGGIAFTSVGVQIFTFTTRPV